MGLFLSYRSLSTSSNSPIRIVTSSKQNHKSLAKTRRFRVLGFGFRVLVEGLGVS